MNETDLYFISGMLNDEAATKVSECFRYNIKTKEMTKIAPIKRARSSFGITHIRNYIYVLGGEEEIF